MHAALGELADVVAEVLDVHRDASNRDGLRVGTEMM